MHTQRFTPHFDVRAHEYQKNYNGTNVPVLNGGDDQARKSPEEKQNQKNG